MARQAAFNIRGSIFRAGINKIDRDKIYGYVKEFTYDANGEECVMGSVLNDGSTFVLSGSTAIKKVDGQLHELGKDDIKTVKLDGSEAELVASVFEEEKELSEFPLEKVLDLQVELAYQLSFEDDDEKNAALKLIDKDKAYYFVYNWRTDYEGSDAFIVSNGTDIFALSGKIIEFTFLDNKTMVAVDEAEDESEDDELDFSMF